MSVELKPCPFCGGEAELIDQTKNFYGFNGYMIRCKCGCRLYSDLPTEHYWKDGKYCTPMTEQSKAKALNGVINLWNERADK